MRSQEKGEGNHMTTTRKKPVVPLRTLTQELYLRMEARLAANGGVLTALNADDDYKRQPPPNGYAIALAKKKGG